MKTPSWIRVPVMPEVDDRLHEAFPDTTSGVRNVAAHFDGQCGSHRQGMKVVAGLCFCIGGVVFLHRRGCFAGVDAALGRLLAVWLAVRI